MTEQISEKQAAYLSDLLAKADARWPEQQRELSIGQLSDWIAGSAWDAGTEMIREAGAQTPREIRIKLREVLQVFVNEVSAWRQGFEVSALDKAQATAAIDALKKYGSLAALYLALIPGFYLVGYAPDIEAKFVAHRVYFCGLVQRTL